MQRMSSAVRNVADRFLQFDRNGCQQKVVQCLSFHIFVRKLFISLLTKNLLNACMFLPRDAVIVRYMLWPCVCLCVRLFVRLSQVAVVTKQL